MRFLHKIYYDNDTLEILHLSFQDSDNIEDDAAEDDRVFNLIGNARETVSVILFPEPVDNVEAQLKSNMVPRVTSQIVEDTEGHEKTDENGNIVLDENGDPVIEYDEPYAQFTLSFVPRIETEKIPTYSELVELWEKIEGVL